jgi:hypothetical protein
MYKKITGVSEETIREHMRAAKVDFNSIFSRVEEAKERYH